jgi:hypothetical protein
LKIGLVYWEINLIQCHKGASLHTTGAGRNQSKMNTAKRFSSLAIRTRAKPPIASLRSQGEGAAFFGTTNNILKSGFGSALWANESLWAGPEPEARPYREHCRLYDGPAC